MPNNGFKIKAVVFTVTHPDSGGPMEVVSVAAYKAERNAMTKEILALKAAVKYAIEKSYPLVAAEIERLAKG